MHVYEIYFDLSAFHISDSVTYYVSGRGGQIGTANESGAEVRKFDFWWSETDDI